MLLSTYLLTDSSPPSLAKGVAERVLIFLLDDVFFYSVPIFTYATRATARQKQLCFRSPRSFYLSSPYHARCCFISALFCSVCN